MKKKLLLLLAVLCGLALVSGCATDSGEIPEGADAEMGTLAFAANGEDFVRQGFISKDGWALSFEHIYVNLSDLTAYQTEPPYDSESGKKIESSNAVALPGVYTVDLAEGDENAAPILVGTAEAPAGHYNAISWKIANAASGPAQGNSLVVTGRAEKEGRIIDFNLRIDKQYQYSAGEFVGDERKGIVAAGAEADVEMTFHFDHIFGDADTAADDGLNLGALGFEPLAGLARDGRLDVDMADLKQGLTGDDYSQWLEILPALGHVGEGHAYAEEI